MTTLQIQQGNNYFEASILEDSMEVTEDADHQLDAGNDIDIDLDLDGDVQPDEQDECMGEENEEDIGAGPSIEQYSSTGHDDEMVDDDFTDADGLIAQSSSLRDEELEDAANVDPDHDDTIVDHAVEDPARTILDPSESKEANSPSEQHQDTNQSQNPDTIDYEDDERAVERGKHENELADTSETSPNVQRMESRISPSRSDFTHQPITQDGGEDPWVAQHGISAASHTTASAIRNPPLSDNTESNTPNDEIVQPGIESQIDSHIQGSDPARFPGAEPEEVIVSSPERPPLSPKPGPETHTQTQPIASEGEFSGSSVHAHPVMIVYQDNEMSLFPPINQQAEGEEEEEERSSTYFLQDEQLVGTNIQNLLTEFRSVLGESIGEQDELIIDIEELGIHISEFSTDCSTTSLSEIIYIYLHLQSYDGLHNPPPLYMNLTTKTRFPYRMESLLVAVTEKKGLSQTRPSFAVDEHEQFEAEDATSPNSQDHLLGNDDLPDHNDETSASASDEQNVRVKSNDDNTQQDPTTSTNHSERSGKASPALKTNHGVTDEAFIHQLGVTEVDGRKSESNQDGFIDPTPTAALHSDSIDHGEEKPTVDDDDIIDYEDDDEPTHGTSSASSTLQGDGFDVDNHENKAKSTEVVPEAVIADSPSNDSHREIAAGKEKVNNDTAADTFGDPNPSTIDKDHPNFVENDTEFLESSNGNNKEALRDIGRFSPPQIDAIGEVPDNEESLSQQINGVALVPVNKIREQQNGITNGGADLERTTFAEEQRHEGRSNTKRLDYEAIDDSLHRDQFQEESGGGLESTKYGELNGVPTAKNGDLASEPSLINKPDRSPHSVDQSQNNDDDEITYEDEEDDEYLSSNLPIKQPSGGSSPGSHKRPRSLRNDDNAVENEPRDTKRVRSS